MAGMRETSFGAMRRIVLPLPLAADVEVMQFAKPGRPHTHDRAEIAIATQGAGVVVIDGERYTVASGDWVRIPAGAAHYMEPSGMFGLTMLIAYEGGEVP